MNPTPDPRKVLAIIPARGGSKGIPRKNLVPLGGIPLVAHSIKHALAATSVTRTIVSTEDSEIASVARAYGAEVPFLRPAQLAGDEVLDLPVFAHVLDELRETEGYEPDVVVHLRPTAPLRIPEWIDAAVRRLVETPMGDSVRSVSAPTQHPYRVFRIGEMGLLTPVMGHEHPEPYLLRRQDLPAMYYYNCVIDVTRPRTIREQRSMTGSNIVPFVMAPDDVHDIDSMKDLEIVRCLYPTWVTRSRNDEAGG
jgi:N-acylneuraminate cytidylyltransferase